MNKHLSNVLRQNPLYRDHPPNFEVCLKNPLKDECWAWDITHVDMNDFVRSFPAEFWEADWKGTNSFVHTRAGMRPAVGITNIDREWTAWLPMGSDTYLSIEEYFSKKLHLIKVER